MHVRKVELLVLIRSERRRASDSYLEFVIDTATGKVELTNIPDSVLYELYHHKLIEITPSEKSYGVRPCTLEVALSHLDFRFSTGTVDDKHNRDGIFEGDHVELYTLKGGKRHHVVLEGKVGDIRAGVLRDRSFRPIRQKEAADALV